MDFFGKTIDGSRSLYLDELTVTWNADILATSLFSKPAIFDTTLKITETLTLGDTNSVTLSPNFIITPYSLFLPPTQGTSNTFLENNGSGVLTWRSSLTLPYVTSVALTAPSFLTVSGSPITSSGTISLTYSGTPLPVLNGGTGVTTSTGTGNNVLSNDAYLTGADLTNTYLDGTLTLSEPLSTANGGTGLDTIGTNNQVLTSNGSNLLWTTPTTGTVTSVALTTPDFLTVSGSPITSSGTFVIDYSGIPLPVINGGTGVDLSTGTGRVVLNTNPILDSAVMINDTIVDGALQCLDDVEINGGLKINLPSSKDVEIDTGVGSGTFKFNSSSPGSDSFDAFIVAMSGASATSISTSGIGAISLSSVGLGAISLSSTGLGAILIKSTGAGGISIDSLVSGNVRLSASLPLATYGAILELIGFNSTSPTTQGTINLRSNVPITGNVNISSLATTSVDATQALDLGSTTCLSTTLKGAALSITGTATASITSPAISFTGPTTVTGTLTATTALTTLGAVTAGAITATALNSPTLNTPTLLALNAPTIVVNTALLNILNPIAPNVCAVNIATAGGAFNLATGGGAATFTMGAGLFSVVTVLGRIQLYTGAGITGAAIDIKALVGDVNLGTGGGNVNITSGIGAIFITASTGGLQLGENSTTNRLCRIYSNISNGPGVFEEGDLYLETVDRGFNGTCDFRINTSQGKVGKIGHYSKGNFEIASNLNGTAYNPSSTACLSINTSALTSSYTLTFPPTTGSASQVLTTNGSGELSWTTPTTGTVTSVSATVPAFLSVTGSPITTSGTLAIDYSGTALPTLNGGTGLTAVGTNGQVLTSDGTTLSWQTPLPPGTGTVTSVSATVPAFLNVTGSPITNSGTLAIDYSGTALPTLNGGTGLTTVGTNGQVLTSNGSTLSWQTPAPPGTGTVTSVSASVPSFLTISGSPITNSGTLAISYSGAALPVANGGTGSTTATGTGSVVLNTNATLSGTTLNGTTNVTQGIKVNGGAGASGWSSLFSGIGTGNNAGLLSDPNVNGFNFGWNVSAGDGENVMTYFTGAGSAPRLDICSWNGTTRTTTLRINSSGGVTFGSNLYPTIQGTSGQVLTTNGSGTLSWQTPSSPGTGTVTSVALTTPDFLTVSGSPITTSGTLAISYSGTALPVLNGGTGVTASTGTGSVVLNTNATLSGTTLNGTTNVTQGLKVNGGAGASGWSSLFSGIGTGNNAGLSSDPNVNGFNFGWNVSAGDGENVMTYFTGAGSAPRLDICSWNGTTRTTTISINSSGVVSIPLGAIISSGVTVNGDSLFTSSVTINGITRTPQINGSGTSGDLTITSTRNLTTNVSSNYNLTSTNINLTSPNVMFANSKRFDNTYGYMDFFLQGVNILNNSATPIELNLASKTRGFPLTFAVPTLYLENTLGQAIIVTATFSVTRTGANNLGQSQSWIETSASSTRRYGFGAPTGGGLGIRSATAVFTLDVNESFALWMYQDSGSTQPYNGINFNTSGNPPTYLFISYAGI